MNHPSPDYPFVALKDALQSLTGAGIAMVMVCAMGGAIPVVAGWSNLPDAEDWLLLAVAWVGHWAIAGLMLWGLVALLVPVWSLHELLHGNRNPFLALAPTLIVQLTVSTIAVCIFDYEYERARPIIVSSGTMLLVGAVTVRFFRAEARNQPSERSMGAPRRRLNTLEDWRD